VQVEGLRPGFGDMKNCSVGYRTVTKKQGQYSPFMDDQDRDRERLLKEEREARQRYEQLRGYPPHEQAKALALWQEATEAVREYRSKYG
jgi:hypothetical protein